MTMVDISEIIIAATHNPGCLKKCKSPRSPLSTIDLIPNLWYNCYIEQESADTDINNHDQRSNYG